jgi:putative ABC transport system permease protein
MLTQDVRYAIRALRRTPVFTSVALLSLALGLGATTAVFSIVNAVHFSAMPYPGADRMMLVDSADLRPDCVRRCTRQITETEFRSWSGRIASADALAAFRTTQAVIVTADGADLLSGAEVTANFFSTFGMQAAAGRTLTGADEQAPDEVAVLGFAAAQKYFGRAEAAVGRAVRLDNHSRLIVGVLPANARVGWPLLSRRTAYFVPMRPGLEARVTVVARIAPSATSAALSSEIQPLLDPAVGVTATAPHTWGPRLTPMRTTVARPYQASFGTMLGAVAFVLLIACVNLAGLFVTRLMGRQRELAIRAALGAARGRLLRQMLVEVMVISGAGGVLGIGVAYAGTALARQLPAGNIPFWTTFAIDGRVVLFALGATVLTALVFGVWPAALVSRRSLQRSVREAGGGVIAGGSRVTLRTVVVALEIACTMILLTGAGLLVKTFVDAEARDLGMSRYDVLEAQVNLSAPQYASAGERSRFAASLLERTARIPGVQAVGLMGRGRPPAPGITVEGETEVAPNSTLVFGAWDVTPDYFHASGIAMISGHPFTAADTVGSQPVAILDEPTAQHLFPGSSAVGKRVKLGPPSSPEPWMTVVGVTATAHGDPLAPTREYFPVLYRALTQYPDTGMGIYLKMSGSPMAGAQPLRAIIRDLDATLPIMGVQTTNDAFEDWIWPLRLNTMVMSGFALFALALSAIGVAGVIAALVASRTREIGIRVALGATRRSVLGLVMRAGLRLALAGVVVGLAGSFALTRVLRTLLYGASTTDPIAFTAASLLFVAVALLATYLPARRALRVDPLTAFRPE